MEVTEKDVRNALKAVKDPELNLDLVVLNDNDDTVRGLTEGHDTFTQPGCCIDKKIIERLKKLAKRVNQPNLPRSRQRCHGETSRARRHDTQSTVSRNDNVLQLAAPLDDMLEIELCPQAQEHIDVR